MLKLHPLLAVGTAILVSGAAAARAQTPTTVVVSSSPASLSVLGQAVSFAAAVVPPGGGRVAFLDGGVVIGEAPADAGGVATFTTANLTTGVHSIVAQYLGQDGFFPSSSTALTFSVGKRPTALSLGPATTPLGVGEIGRITVTVMDTGTAGPPGAPGSFTAVPATLAGPRMTHTATRLRDGRVLIVGGSDGNGHILDAAHSVEIFDPAAGTFTPVAGGLLTPRRSHTATLLQDGTVLVAGGLSSTGATLDSAERYDPVTGEFTAVPGHLQTARYAHSAVLLSNGTVLLIGGTPLGGGVVLDSIEAYKDGAFHVASGMLDTARMGASATLLADGQTILVAGGTGSNQNATSTVEFLTYAPASDTVTLLGLAWWSNPYAYHTATRLPDGGILFTGGYPTGGYSTTYAFVYHPPAVLTFPLQFAPASVSPGLGIRRGAHAAALLDDGRVLLVGGISATIGTVSSAEVFRPAFEPTGTPVVSSSDPTDAVYSCLLAFSGNGAAACGERLVPATIGAGSRTLTVSWTGDDNHLAPGLDTATAMLPVEKGDPQISWYAASIVYGTPLGASQLSASAQTSIRGSSPLPGRFTYDPPAGTLLSAGSHTLSVTFTPTDTANFNSASMTTRIAVSKATPTLRWDYPQEIVHGTPLGSTQLAARATDATGSPVPGSYTYTPPAGTVLYAGYQRLAVTFTPSDTTDYEIAYGSTYQSVSMATPEITWASPADITYGTPLSAAQLDASAGTSRGAVPGTFTYSPPAGTVLAAGPAQVLTATFRPNDTLDYSTPPSKTVAINVRKATPTITWAAPPELTYGEALSEQQLNATATGASGSLDGTFLYSPSPGTVLGAGTDQRLAVSFIPVDGANYVSAGQEARVSVRKATPIGSWANPPSIVHGTPLGAEQLGAEFLWAVGGIPEVVTGTAVYDPPAGTVLPPGPAQPLTVHFVPDDVLDYESPPDMTVTIDVLPDLAITPASATVTAGDSTTFTAAGGSRAGFVWTMATNLSGGSITPQGVYTAGSTAGVSDVVQVRDSQGSTATATVEVRAAATPDEDNGGGGCSSGGGAGAPSAAAGLLLALVLRRRRRA